MKHWIIKAFCSTRGENVIKKWLEDLPVGAQVEIETRLRYLETQKVWGRPYSAKRKVGSGKIHEIRVKWHGNQYRPLGFFGPASGDFTLLIGAQEKDFKLMPLMADDVAEKRRKLVTEDPKTYARKYFDDLQEGLNL